MATEPADGIHDYNIPIPQHKLPPAGDDYRQPRRRRPQPPKHDPVPDKPPGSDGHIDDYA